MKSEVYRRKVTTRDESLAPIWVLLPA